MAGGDIGEHHVSDSVVSVLESRREKIALGTGPGTGGCATPMDHRIGRKSSAADHCVAALFSATVSARPAHAFLARQEINNLGEYLPRRTE
jgi:hypothetical protein